MTVTMEQYGSADRRWRVPGHLALEELAQEKGLLSQSISARIVWKQVAQLVAKHRRAARLEHDNGPARIDCCRKAVHHTRQVLLRFRQKAEVVQRTAAAHVAAWNNDIEP